MNRVIGFFRKQMRIGLFLILFISTWCVLSSSIVYLMPLSALKKSCGQIEYLDRKMYKCGSGRYSVRTCAKTAIRLKYVSGTFRIRTGINDGGLIGGISVGDTVCIYSRRYIIYIQKTLVPVLAIGAAFKYYLPAGEGKRGLL